jgi:UDP-N-acetyl-D-glucosamine dehydrogenase
MADASVRLVQKLQDRKALIGVIGLGYVGLPLVREFTRGGAKVLGFDIDQSKVKSLLAGRSYIEHIPSSVVRDMLAGGRFDATADFRRLREPDCIIICVPTPLTKQREPDMSYIVATSRAAAATLRKGQLIVLESTTYPGTTREVVLPILEAGGLKAGSDFFLAFSPEREDPGRKDYSTKTIPKVVGGLDAASLKAAVACYQIAVDNVVAVSTCEVAEAAKILENTYRCVNIAMVNELKTLFDRMGIDVWEVIRAASTKPFGFTPFYPGPGLGGHCIPLDPFYLSWKVAEFGMWTRFIELAGEINTRMPSYVVHRLSEALAEERKTLNGARVLVLGLSYKADIDDDRESPSYELIALLRERGAEVSYCDPHFPVARPGRRNNPELRSVPLTPEEFGRYDLLLLSTAHAQFRDPALYRDAKLVVDTRNVVREEWAPKVVRA